MRILSAFSALLMTLSASAAYAQTLTAPDYNKAPAPVASEAVGAVGGDAIPALPLEMLTENGVSYISGGIGDEEKEQLKAQETNFNIHVLITGLNGEFVSSVKFRLLSPKGAQIINIEDAGPYVYVKIPAGSYDAEITSNGAVQKIALKVPAKGAVKKQVRVAG